MNTDLDLQLSAWRDPPISFVLATPQPTAANYPSHFRCYSCPMRVAIRDLRNDTRSVIEAVERGVEVVLTRRGHPIARIVPMEPDDDDLATWLDEVTADPRDSGLLAEIDRLRRDEDDTDDRRLGPT